MSATARIVRRARGWLRSRRRLTAPAPPEDSELDELEARIVWIFSSPRAGSTWLLRLLAGACSGATAIDEPRLGAHLALLEGGTGGPHRRNESFASNPSYLFSRRYEQAWRPALRRFVLARMRAEALDGGDGGGPILIKEPNGSQAADLIAEALPGSRLIHLIRDPADIIDSLLDAAAAGGWLGHSGVHRDERLGFIDREAALWAHRHEAISRAVGMAAPGRAVEARYEELLRDTGQELTRLASWIIGDEPEAERVATTVAREAFDAVPEGERGPGRPVRAAQPGLWRHNLDRSERELVARLLDENRRALGYG